MHVSSFMGNLAPGYSKISSIKDRWKGISCGGASERLTKRAMLRHTGRIGSSWGFTVTVEAQVNSQFVDKAFVQAQALV